jgi:hypothetical protein
MWMVDVGVPFGETYDAIEVASELEQEVAGRYSDAAGCGFGYRDLQFEFDHYQEAYKLWAAIEGRLAEKHQDVKKNDYYNELCQVMILP